MHVWGFVSLLLGFVITHPITNPVAVYDCVEQYKADTMAYYYDLYQQKAEEARLAEEARQAEAARIAEQNKPKYGDAGHLDIPDIGVNVGLYYDSNAFQCSGKASYQYWIQYGKFWIADHVNQDGFGSLKNLCIGSVVNVCDEDGVCRSYTVAESVYYADYYSNFEGCGALSKMSDYRNVGGIVLQTCEGNGARLVFCQ